jgi:hypothetical protein
MGFTQRAAATALGMKERNIRLIEGVGGDVRRATVLACIALEHLEIETLPED